MKLFNWLCVGLISVCAVSQAANPTVSNVVSTQRAGTKLVDIYFDTNDPQGDDVDVSITVKVDGQIITTDNFYGDIGLNVRPGTSTGKHIIWDAGSDWDEENSSNVVIEVTVDDGLGDAPPAGMVLVPGGTNVHWIQSFYMDETEVTLAQWNTVREWALTNGYNAGYFPTASAKGLNHPVHTIQYYHAVYWCNARSEMEGRQPAYLSSGNVSGTSPSRVPLASVNPAAHGFWLPSVNVWQYAARGGNSDLLFPWGDTISQNQANYESYSGDPEDITTTIGYHPLYDIDGFPYTCPVKSFPPNSYGLYEMVGNVAEWTSNTYASDRYTCGGSWTDWARYLKITITQRQVYNEGLNTLGFRTVSY